MMYKSFKWSLNGRPESGWNYPHPSAAEISALQKDINTTGLALLEKEQATHNTLQGGVLAQNLVPEKDHHTSITIYSQLVASRLNTTQSEECAIDAKPHIDEVLRTVRNEGHNINGTRVEAEAKTQITNTRITEILGYNTLLSTHQSNIMNFGAALNNEKVRQQGLDQEYQTLALKQQYQPLGMTPNQAISLARTIPSKQLIHKIFFDEISETKNIAAFDIALARVPEINAKNSKGVSIITSAAKHMFEYGIRALLEKGALTADTFLLLLKYRHDEAVKLLIKLVGPRGYDEIFTGLSFDDTVTHLNLSDTVLSPEAIAGLATALKKNQSVTYLDLSGNNIGEDGSEKIGELLLANNKIKHLKLARVNIKDQDGIDCTQNITIALQENKVVEELDLSKSAITYDGGIFIARMFLYNARMKVLDIGDNNIGDIGACYIAQDLENNKHLLSIDLSKNNITDEGAEFIAEWLGNNSSVISLDLTGNRIGAKGAEFFKTAIARNKSLIKFNGIEDTDGQNATKIAANFASFKQKLSALNAPDSFPSSGDVFRDLFVLYQQIASKVDISIDDVQEQLFFSKIHTICLNNHFEQFSGDPYAAELLARFPEVTE